MLTFRTFRNTDPPLIADLWRSRAGQPGMAAGVTCDLLEQLVFGKLAFDYQGLVLALDDDRPVGFAHAGFGPNDAGSDITTEVGVVSIIVVRPGENEAAVADALLERCETYLLSRGAKTIYGGEHAPRAPFYAGLYGGSEPPGVLDSDEVVQRTFAARGYHVVRRLIQLQRNIEGFVAPIDRRQLGLRRRMRAEVTLDAPTRTRCEAALWGEFELTRFDVFPLGATKPAGWAILRNMEAVASGTVSHAAGLIELVVEPPFQGQGLAMFLLTEACRQFARQDARLLYTQVVVDNAPVLGLLAKLALTPSGAGNVYRKA